MRNMNQNMVFHCARFPWQHVEGRSVTILLRTGKEEQVKVDVLYCDPRDFLPEEGKKLPALKQKEMEEVFTDRIGRYYRTNISTDSHKLRYHFRLRNEGGEVYYDEMGISLTGREGELRPFLVPYIYECRQALRPAWVKNAVWYQIFPDRFSREDDRRAERFVPDRNNFYGGTLEGIRKKLPYLQELGINAVYLNPVFSSNSNHRYDTTDYLRVDTRLGDEEALKRFAQECHQRGIRIMLDGVYNHCGYDSPIWQDVLENGRKSKFCEWFFIYDYDVLQTENCRNLPSDRMKKNPPYESFAFAANMPKWNTANPETARYLIETAVYWTKQLQVDAWRLDVPDEVDREFLRNFYREIKRFNPEIYIIGEIWQDAHEWLGEGLFDGVMDYPFYFIIRDFFLLGTIGAFSFCDRLTGHCLLQPISVEDCSFHFLSNHDIPRALTVAGNDIEAVKAAYLFLFLMGGTPCVYYGDEVGLEGKDDPDNRRAFPWNFMNEDLLLYFRKLITARNANVGFSDWKRRLIPLDDEKFCLSLEKGKQRIEVVFGRGGRVISTKTDK